MTATLIVAKPEAPPLREEPAGVFRVGKSRILLELVIDAYHQGATPEQIVERYDTLALADVYAVIAYYLRHREAVDKYVAEREKLGDIAERDSDARNADLDDLRARLAARRKAAP